MNLPVFTNKVGLMAAFVQHYKTGFVLTHPKQLLMVLAQSRKKGFFQKFSKLHQIAEKEFSRKTQAVAFRKTVDKLI